MHGGGGEELIVGLLAAVIAHVLLFALVPDTVSSMVRDREKANPLLAVLGYALFGAVVGYASTAAFPRSLSATVSIRSINLVLTPALCGAAMHFVGGSRRQRGIATTYLESFRGGAALAFGTVLTRFLVVPFES